MKRLSGNEALKIGSEFGNSTLPIPIAGWGIQNAPKSLPNKQRPLDAIPRRPRKEREEHATSYAVQNYVFH